MQAVEHIIKLVHSASFRSRRISMFQDFIERTAIRISNNVDPSHYAERRARLAEIEGTHTAGELAEMDACLKTLVLEIQDKALSGIFEDILGRAYEGCGLCDNGQDFTFPDVASLMNGIVFREDYMLPKAGFFSFYEGACGSGALVLAAAGELSKAGVDYTRKMVVLANDIDRMCVHMAYIQLSQYGIPAVVTQGNTITEKELDRWYTPQYVLGEWAIRSPFYGNSLHDHVLKRTTIQYYDALQLALELTRQKGKDENDA